MGKLIFAAALAALIVTNGAWARPAHSRPPASAPDFAVAVAAPGRPADQVKLDAVRHPAEILAFEGLRRGDMVLDLFAGGGYYTEIMARAVGPMGGVLAWDPANFANDKTRAAFTELKGRAPNTGIFVTPANALSLPPNAFDFVMIHLNYHDFYWESAKYGFPRVDPQAILASVYQAVKPGGIVAVIDHVGPAGDTRALVDKLHRIDPAVIRADFDRAGFKLEAESNMLRNPADDHSKLVFDPSIRGVTDRVVYRFRKPAR